MYTNVVGFVLQVGSASAIELHLKVIELGVWYT